MNTCSWRNSRLAISISLFLGLLLGLPAFAQSLSQLAPLPASQIQGQAINESQRVTLKGHIHPLAQAQFDRGVVADGTPAEHVIMLLQRTPDQIAAADAVVDQLHNRNSPMFHQWLTADEYGRHFGPSDSDMATLTAWLKQKGFTVEDVPPGRTHVTFSGTAGQMRQVFNAEFHNLDVNGEKHIAVLKEPTIPAALAPLVAGFKQLHDWYGKPNFVPGNVMKKNKQTGAWEKILGAKSAPELTYAYSGSTYYDVTPQDWYTIYNTNPLYQAGVTGAGVTIAVIEETEVKNQSDITSFRSQFGLPTYPATPNATQGGVNWIYGPGNGCTAPADPTSTSEEGEALLDTEWSGAIAPNAIVDFVACKSTGSSIGSQGTDLAASYIANYLYTTVSATSLSYGECEASAGTTGKTYYTNEWQQMAAEGITAVVSSGDAGSAGCNQNATYESSNIGVSAFSTTAYNISAGGTDFSDVYQIKGGTPSTYWNTTNSTTPYGSALSYIPEISWGAYCANPLFVSYLQALGNTTYTTTYTPEYLCASSGMSSYRAVVGGEGGISSNITIPTWQSVYGIGNGVTSTTYRNQPDISFFASSGWWGHALVYCQSDSGYACNYASGVNDAYYLSAGGTSFVSPSVAGMMALINQNNGRQGVANYTLYNLAANQYGTPGTPKSTIANCSGSALGTGVASSCIFNDIANDTPCLAGSTMCGTATTGFTSTGPGSGALNATSISSDIVQSCKYSSVTNCYRALSTHTYGLSAVGSHTTTPAYQTAQGYDLATGLGSVNVANLVTNWNTVSAGFVTTTTISANPTTVSASAPTTTLTASVVATGRGGIVAPAGIVTFYLGSSSGANLGTASLVQGTCTGLQNPISTSAAGSPSCPASASLVINASALQGGANNIVAVFSGDGANDAASTSGTPAVVTLNATSQTITFTGPGTQVYSSTGSNTVNLSATASSGLAVTFTVISGPAAVSGSTLTLTGPGTVKIEADQAGNSNYSAAPPVDVTFDVYGAPSGNLDLAVDSGTSKSVIAQATGTLYVSGWAADAVDGSPLSNVKVYIDGVSVGTPTLGVARPDVASYFGNSAWANSGYTFTYAASNMTGGTHKVTVIAINAGGVSTTFGPLTITVTSVPVGSLELAVDASTSLTTVKQNDALYVKGWAADPTDGSPLKNVVVYVDGVAIGAPTLGIARPDVATYFNKPAYANSGYVMNYSAASLSLGAHAVTVIATNSAGNSITMGPLSITVSAAAAVPPTGNLDLAVDNVTATSTVLQADSLYVAGWAASYVNNGPVSSVQILIDGTPVGLATLGIARPDVATYFNKPGWANTGWVFVISASGLTTGPHTVSAVASDGLTTTLGPVAITVQ